MLSAIALLALIVEAPQNAPRTDTAAASMPAGEPGATSRIVAVPGSKEIPIRGAGPCFWGCWNFSGVGRIHQVGS